MRSGCGLGVEVHAFGFASFSGQEEFLVACGKDGLFVARQLVGRCNVANRGVKADSVVVFDEVRDQAPSVIEAKRDARAQAIAFQ